MKKLIALLAAGALVAFGVVINQAEGQNWRSSGGASFPLLGPDGNSTAPTYSFSGSSTTGFYRAGAGDVRLSFNNDRIKFLSNPSLHISSADNNYPALLANVQLAQTSADVVQLAIQQFVSSTGGPILGFTKARSGLPNAPTVITTGDDLGVITARGYVGATNGYQEAANITFDSTGTISDSATGIAGQIKFLTAKTGAEPAEVLRIDNVGHTIHLGTSPVIGACGTSPSLVGKDEAMTITVGSGGAATTCAVTFANAFTTNPPVCVAQNNTDRVAYSMVTTTTGLTITASAAFTAGSKFHVICRGWE